MGNQIWPTLSMTPPGRLKAFLMHKYGGGKRLLKIGDQKMVDVLAAIQKYRKTSPRIRLFGQFLLSNSQDPPGSEPPLDHRALGVVAKLVHELIKTKCVPKHTIPSDNSSSKDGHDSGSMDASISQSGAGQTDSGTKLILVLRSLALKLGKEWFSGAPAQAITRRIDKAKKPQGMPDRVYIGLDEVVGIFMEEWVRADGAYQRRLRECFSHYSTTYALTNGFMVELEKGQPAREGVKVLKLADLTAFRGCLKEMGARALLAGSEEIFEAGLAAQAELHEIVHRKKWRQMIDPQSKRTYFHCEELQESYWECPMIFGYDEVELEEKYFIRTCLKHRLHKPVHTWF